MPFQRPTLVGIDARIAADIESRLPGADARLRRSVLAVLHRALAGAVHGLYGYLGWLARQLMPDTAEAAHLERWASIWHIGRRLAVAATGNATVTGADGAVIPAGARLQRGDGAIYRITAPGRIASGGATVTVTAETPGAGGNSSGATALAFVSPLAGVQAAATVAADGLGGGADTESDAALRARLLDRIRRPPHGGAEHDYRAWALAVPSVSRAWVYPSELGLSTVTVRVMADTVTESVIPGSATVAVVKDYIDARRPVTADVTVVAPVAAPLDVTASVTPESEAVKAAVTASLADLIRREAEPGGTLLVSHIREAISAAAGEHDHNLVAPATDVTHATGHIATMGRITWQ